ncbi:MAG TPA: DUF3096 domain-containing protein [Euryarchaeota archaeon]|nr:MAG: hypothetical protein DRN46_03755 [Thermococci archaeon]HDI10436.1 DUF3096 domain-containing protein [Euryarchaeota archaeon]
MCPKVYKRVSTTHRGMSLLRENEKLLGAISLVLGLLILAEPELLRILVALFLIVWGLVKLMK